MKICKQCGKQLPEESFRPYYSRSAGLRKSVTGRNTICITCEKFNATVTRYWRAGAKTDKERELLTQAAEYYKSLVDAGLQPIGAYAKHVLGIKSDKTSNLDKALDVMKQQLSSEDTTLTAYQKLLNIELTEEPDVYQDMLLALLDKSVGLDGRVKPKYKEVFNEIARRFDDYEDSYVW